MINWQINLTNRHHWGGDFLTKGGVPTEYAYICGHALQGTTPDRKFDVYVHMPSPSAHFYRVEIKRYTGGLPLLSRDFKTLRGLYRRLPRLLVLAALMT